jgi:hypothetical protein
MLQPGNWLNVQPSIISPNFYSNSIHLMVKRLNKPDECSTSKLSHIKETISEKCRSPTQYSDDKMH